MSKSMVLPKPWQRGQAPNGRIEAEQDRLRLVELHAAGLALELLVEAQCSPPDGAFEDHFARFAVADLDGVDQALVQVRADRDAVHQHEQRLGEIDIEQRFRRGEFEQAAVLKQAVEALLAQVEEMIAQRLGGGVLAARKQRVPARALGLARAPAPPPRPPCPCARACRSSGRRSGPRARRAGAGNRSTRWRWRRWSADCASCSSAGWRRPARCRRSRPRRAFPCAPGTGARRRRAIRRSAAALRRRWCRRPATICRTPTHR